MKLKQKIFYLIFSLLIIYAVYRFLFQIFVVSFELTSMENSQASRDLDRVNNLLQIETQNLLTESRDWSVWNSTYKFVQGEYPTYVGEELTQRTLSDLNLDVFMIYDSENKLCWSDLSWKKDINDKVIDDFSSEILKKYKSVFFKGETSSNDVRTGILATEHGSLLFAAAPILKDHEKTQPCAGTLIIGKFLQKDYLKTLSTIIMLNFEVYTPQSDNASFVSKIKECKSNLCLDSSSSKDFLYLYSIATIGNTGDPLILKIEIPRELFLNINNLNKYTLISLVLAIIIIVLVSWIVLNSVITKPLSSLTELILKISRTKDFTIKVESKRKDEIGILAREFSNLLQAVTEARSELETNIEQKDELIVKLNEALNNIKTLKELLPICSCCKKIRDDNGYWNQVESYISHNTDTKFSHSICPECIRKLYPEEADLILSKLEEEKKQ